MRPTILYGFAWIGFVGIGFAWTVGSCAWATAQSPEQRPTNLRNSGVITRAAPPTSLGANAAQQAPSPGSLQPPPNFPMVPTSDPPSALSDRAWTNAPARPQATASLSDEPTPSRVAQAQFTGGEGHASSAVSGQVRLANHQATVGDGAKEHEPRPLKPPSTPESKAGAKGSTGTVQMFVSVVSSLAIVIGLILAAAWFYRKAAPTMSGALPKQVVQVLGRTPLAPRQQLVLLRLGSKLVLVSNLHGEVRTISEITDPLEVDRLAGLCESAQPGSISDSFRSVLHNMGRNG